MARDWICRGGALAAAAAFVAVWLADPVFSPDPLAQTLWKSLLSRILGSLVFVFVLVYLRYRVWQRPRRGTLWAVLPALAVVVNNLPILALATGSARVERTDLIWLFALDALFIGVFEEMAFRGVLFPVLLERYGETRRGIVCTTVLSSAVFGLIHLVNLAEGAGLGPTVLQVGYSFLIGGMCAIVLLRSGNLLFCILLHGIYDFCGGLLPTLGGGSWWDTPTVIVTAVLAVAVTIWMLILLSRTGPEEVRWMKPKGEKNNDGYDSD